MESKHKGERNWRELCAEAAKEPNGDELVKLIAEIDDLMDAEFGPRTHGTRQRRESTGSSLCQKGA
jgi:hypothetical protein